MNIEFNDKDIWAALTIDAVSQRLVSLQKTIVTPEGEHFLGKVQEKVSTVFEDFKNNKAGVFHIATLSLYTDLLEKYKNTGAISHLQELDARLNADSSI